MKLPKQPIKCTNLLILEDSLLKNNVNFHICRFMISKVMQ